MESLFRPAQPQHFPAMWLQSASTVCFVTLHTESLEAILYQKSVFKLEEAEEKTSHSLKTEGKKCTTISGSRWLRRRRSSDYVQTTMQFLTDYVNAQCPLQSYRGATE